MKEIGFTGLAAVIGGLVSTYLPDLPGMHNQIVLIGIFASLAGAALGVLAAKMSGLRVAIAVAAALATLVVAFITFLHVAGGVPGNGAAIAIDVCTTALFLAAGFIIEIVGIKLT